MFSNFKSSFLNKDEAYSGVPKEVIGSLNEKLPEGFEYIHAGDGVCHLIPKAEGKLKLKLEVPNSLIEKHNITNWNKLSEYSYRTQTPILLSENDLYPIEINGSKFKFEDIIKVPFENLSSPKVYLSPTPFSSFEVNIEGGEDEKIEYIITVKRQPYDDMNKSLFKSIDNNVLEFTYILDEIEKSINFNVKINLDKANSVREIVKGLKLYHSCLKGNMKFAGYNLPSTDNEEKGIKETIDFWSRVLEIEVVSGIQFNANSDVTMDDAMDIEKLYRSLIENRFYKEYVSVGNIITEKAGVLDKEYKDSIIEAQGLMLEFIESSEFILWGTTLTTYDCVKLSDIKVEDILLKDKEKQEYEFILESKPKQKVCKFIRHFLKKEEARDYETKGNDLDKADLITIS